MRLIDADSLMQYLASRKCECVDDVGKSWNYGIDTAIRVVDQCITIDAEPVRHGHWVWGSAWYPPTCSVCNLVPLTPGYVGDMNFYKIHFGCCPHCGAKMDE